MQLNKVSHSIYCHGRTLGIVLNIASVFGILYTRNGTFESNNAGVFRMRSLVVSYIQEFISNVMEFLDSGELI